MDLFRITIQIAGHEESVRAEHASRGIAVQSARGVVHVGDLHAAIDFGGRTLGPHLERARRNGAPWGLHVAAWGYEAVYGTWPLLSVPSGEPKRETPVSRIRARFRPEDGPLDALRNAIEIIEAVAPAARRAA
jgi:hypothetical protein